MDAASTHMAGTQDDHDPLFPGKQFISTILDALDTKHHMSGSLTIRYLQRAAMAGFIIGVMYLVNYTIVGGVAALPNGANLAIVGKLLGALAFGWALVFIYYTKSELLTSNMMIVTIGGYHRRTTLVRGLRILGLCYLGNFVGGFVLALLVKFSTLSSGAVGVAMDASVEHKLAYISSGASGWLDLFCRAVLCNFMINLSMLLVYNGIIKDDLTRSLAMVMAVFIFALEGFEHSVANTVLFTIVAMEHGIHWGPAIGNVVVALIGNFVGGGILIGLYYAYLNDSQGVRGRHSS